MPKYEINHISLNISNTNDCIVGCCNILMKIILEIINDNKRCKGYWCTTMNI